MKFLYLFIKKKNSVKSGAKTTNYEKNEKRMKKNEEEKEMVVTLACEVSIPEDSRASWRTNFGSLPTDWEFEPARHTKREHE